jgi:hypothetical protein
MCWLLGDSGSWLIYCILIARFFTFGQNNDSYSCDQSVCLSFLFGMVDCPGRFSWFRGGVWHDRNWRLWCELVCYFQGSFNSVLLSDWKNSGLETVRIVETLHILLLILFLHDLVCLELLDIVGKALLDLPGIACFLGAIYLRLSDGGCAISWAFL